MKQIRVWILCTLLFSVSPVFGQLQISGDFVYTQRFLDKHTQVNMNFRGDDPFSTVRARLFARNWLTEDVAIFTECLFDMNADARVNGAYAVINNLVPDLVNLKIGLIPSPFGNYGLRSTYFNLNPVIGVPAQWHYKTAMVREPLVIDNQGTLYNANSYILNNRNEYHRGGTPIGYDACWDTGIEANGVLGKFEYAFAMTNSAMSNPTYAADNNGYQYIARLGFNPLLGMRMGISGAVAPYIGRFAPAVDSVQFSQEWVRDTFDLESYQQRLGGVYFEYLVHRIELFSEWVHSEWDVPGLREETLYTQSGYLEIRWDLVPGWYVAGRVDYMDFSKIADPRVPGTSDKHWDVPFVRYEPGIAWRFRREGMIKLVYQTTQYSRDFREDINLLAVQLHMVF